MQSLQTGQNFLQNNAMSIVVAVMIGGVVILAIILSMMLRYKRERREKRRQLILLCKQLEAEYKSLTPRQENWVSKFIGWMAIQAFSNQLNEAEDTLEILEKMMERILQRARTEVNDAKNG